MLDHRIQKGPHSLKALEIRRDERPRLGKLDLQLTRERVRTLAIDRREVDRLGTRAHLVGHILGGNAEDDRGRLPVNVATRLECVDEDRITRQVSQESQLDLRIVGREQKPTRLREQTLAECRGPFPGESECSASSGRSMTGAP